MSITENANRLMFAITSCNLPAAPCRRGKNPLTWLNSICRKRGKFQFALCAAPRSKMRARNQPRFFSWRMSHATRVPPTLMLRPDGLAPAPRHWFANVLPGVSFARSRANSRLAYQLLFHRSLDEDFGEAFSVARFYHSARGTECELERRFPQATDANSKDPESQQT